MMRTLAAVFALLATPALADGVLPFAAVFGDAAGCRLYATGQPRAGDYLLLTADTFSSAALGCDFGALLAAAAASFTIDAVCSPGGSRQLTVSGLEAGAPSVRLDAATIVGPLRPCLPGGADRSAERAL